MVMGVVRNGDEYLAIRPLFHQASKYFLFEEEY